MSILNFVALLPIISCILIGAHLVVANYIMTIKLATVIMVVSHNIVDTIILMV